MRLTRQTNYAIRALMYCAASDGGHVRVGEIANAYAISELFLFKIIQPLVEAGMIETLRGRNGGIRLAKPAAEITLLDVVKVTEDSFAMAECFESGDIDCPLIDACGLNVALRKALNAFFDVLSQYTIEMLVKEKPNMRALLGFDLAKTPAIASA
jgi:Rrf2 family transcriptional regulator, iron-responsive regulator